VSAEVLVLVYLGAAVVSAEVLVCLTAAVVSAEVLVYQ
jgi:hypothetical protein